MVPILGREHHRAAGDWARRRCGHADLANWRARMSTAPVPRRGFALLAVLWVMVSAAALGLTLSLAAREAVATARNRTAAARAMWRAEGCLERSRAAIADAIAGPTFLYQRVEGFVWLRLDSVVMSSSLM